MLLGQLEHRAADVILGELGIIGRGAKMLRARRPPAHELVGVQWLRGLVQAGEALNLAVDAIELKLVHDLRPLAELLDAVVNH